jgi:four helix bundle protein
MVRSDGPMVRWSGPMVQRSDGSERQCSNYCCRIVTSESLRPHVNIDRSFCNQIRDAVASAPANIAEGFGRRSDTEFARFLDFARGSLNECRCHIAYARDRKYIDEEERLALDSLASRAVGAIAGLQRYLRRRKRKRA